MSDTRLAGCCALCDVPIQEVTERVPRDAEGMAGHPLRFGATLPGAKRLTFVLASGQIANCSFCGDCDPQPSDYPALWRRILRAHRLESDNAQREKLRHGAGQSIQDLTEAQQWVHLQTWLAMRDDVPLGVIARQAWSEIR